MMSVSFRTLHTYLKEGYGLEDNFLNDFINNEKCEDISLNYRERIKYLFEKLGITGKCRIIKFDNLSGVDSFSREIFRKQLRNRDIFYIAFLSNRDTCVIFVRDNYVNYLDNTKHLLHHEYAHHYVLTEAKIPNYRPINGDNLSIPPPFADVQEIGEKVNHWYIDNFPFSDSEKWIPYADSIERLSDVCAEKILASYKLSDNFYEYATPKLKEEPALPEQNPILKRYVRRLAIRDTADLLACIKINYPDKNISSLISENKKRLAKINGKYLSNKKIYNMFDELYKLTLDTPIGEYKDQIKYNNIINHIFDVLKIKKVL